jgi:cyanate permease
LAALIFVGSRNLRHVDAALVGYTFACIFAAFSVAYPVIFGYLLQATGFWTTCWILFFLLAMLCLV